LTASDWLVIGIGNEFRRDDAAGLMAAKELKDRALPGLDVVLHHGEGTGLMALWKGRERVVVIDAVSSGRPAGHLHLVDAARDAIPPDLTPFSSHVFGLAGAVELARDLGELPQILWIIGVEGGDFSFGQEPGPEVVLALPKAIDMVIDLVSLRHDRPDISC
jgi:hydrogenase maturation protease